VIILAVYTGNSIVDFLKLSGQDSSYTARKKKAAELGITNYSGTAQQNTQMLGMLNKPIATTPVAAPASVASPVAAPYNPARIEGLIASSDQKRNAAPNLSGLSNINFGAAPTIEPYKDPFEGKINSLLDKYLAYDPNKPYDVTSDPQYDSLKQQYDNAGQSAFNNQIGRLSALTGGRPSTAAVGTATGAQNNYAQEFSGTVLPGLISAEQQRRQNTVSNILNQLEALQGLSKNSYGMYRDTVGDTRYNTELQMTQADKQKQDYLNTVGQFAENYQLEYNRVRDDGDPSNDWQLPIIQSKRQDKIAGMSAANTKAEQEAYEREIEAKKFGLDERMTNAQINNLAADNARQASAAAEKKASDNAFATATPEQLNYFNNAFNYLLEKNGGDGYKAYQQLLRESKDYNASMGTKLFAELGKQLQSYSKSQGTATSINNATTSSVDDLSSIIKTRFVSPATANTEQEIDYQGIADYLESLTASGVDTKITDDLARRWGLSINN
jgi:hypothetical protein